MPLHIDRVDTDLEVVPERSPSESSTDAAPGAEVSELRERLRPIVLEILEEELERIRRERV